MGLPPSLDGRQCILRRGLHILPSNEAVRTTSFAREESERPELWATLVAGSLALLARHSLLLGGPHLSRRCTSWGVHIMCTDFSRLGLGGEFLQKDRDFVSSPQAKRHALLGLLLRKSLADACASAPPLLAVGLLSSLDFSLAKPQVDRHLREIRLAMLGVSK